MEKREYIRNSHRLLRLKKIVEGNDGCFLGERMIDNMPFSLFLLVTKKREMKLEHRVVQIIKSEGKKSIYLRIIGKFYVFKVNISN